MPYRSGSVVLMIARRGLPVSGSISLRSTSTGSASMVPPAHDSLSEHPPPVDERERTTRVGASTSGHLTLAGKVVSLPAVVTKRRLVAVALASAAIGAFVAVAAAVRSQRAADEADLAAEEAGLAVRRPIVEGLQLRLEATPLALPGGEIGLRLDRRQAHQKVALLDPVAIGDEEAGEAPRLERAAPLAAPAAFRCCGGYRADAA